MLEELCGASAVELTEVRYPLGIFTWDALAQIVGACYSLLLYILVLFSVYELRGGVTRQHPCPSSDWRGYNRLQRLNNSPL